MPVGPPPHLLVAVAAEVGRWDQGIPGNQAGGVVVGSLAEGVAGSPAGEVVEEGSSLER